MPPEPTEGIKQGTQIITKIPTSTKPKDNNKGNRKNGTQDINNVHKGKPSMKEILTGFKELWECVKAAKELLKEPWVTPAAVLSITMGIIKLIKRKGRR